MLPGWHLGVSSSVNYVWCDYKFKVYKSEWFKTAQDLQHQKPCVTVYPKLTIAEGKNKVKSELVKNAIKLRGWKLTQIRNTLSIYNPA